MLGGMIVMHAGGMIVMHARDRDRAMLLDVLDGAMSQAVSESHECGAGTYREVPSASSSSPLGPSGRM